MLLPTVTASVTLATMTACTTKSGAYEVEELAHEGHSELTMILGACTGAIP